MLNFNLPEIDFLIETDVAFWNKTRIDIFDILLELSPEDNRWQRDDIPKALKIVAQRLEIKKSHAIPDIRAILKYAAHYGIFNIASALQPFTKKFRHSVFVLSKHEVQFIEISERIVKYIWSDYLNRDTPTEQLLFPFVCSMLADGGHSARHIANNLHRIRVCDVMQDTSILFPLTPEDASNFCCKISIVNPAKLILGKLLRGRRNEKTNEYLFSPELKSRSARKRKFRIDLESQYRELTLKMKIDSGATPPYSTFLRLLPQQILRQGIPPFYVTLTSLSSLPATQKWNGSLSYFGSSSHNSSIKKTKKIHYSLLNTEKCHSHISQPDIPLATHSEQEWKHKANIILAKLRISLDRRGITALKNVSNREHLFKIKDEFMGKANLISHPGSALHLAIEWTIDYVINGNLNIVTSFKTYHSSFFSAGIFRFPNADRYSMFTSDQHKAAIKQNLKLRDLSGDSASHIVCNLFSIYCFATRLGYIKNIDFTLLIDAFNLSKRTIILWPSDYDAHIQKWRDMNAFETNLLAVAADLSYYGGLRESEFLSLSIGDVLFNGKVCEITIHEGKSENARRVIPYHRLAPSKNIEYMREIVAIRKLLSPKDCNLPLFGPDSEKSRYSHSSFLIALRFGLKSTISKGFVPHMLRHCFTNNNIINITAINNPEILNLIPDANHEIYRRDNIKRLEKWIYNIADEGKLGKDNNILWYSAKLLGHSTPEEGLYTYCHIFTYLLESYYLRLNEISDKAYPLTREAAALLLPNMSTDKTIKQKYDPNMTISEATALSWENI